jgi:hypothetical protein
MMADNMVSFPTGVKNSGADPGPAPVVETNLDDLATRIRTRLEQVRGACVTALRIALDVGDALIAAEAQVPDGKWGRWLRDNCFLSVRSAQLYMQLARHRGEIEDKLDQGVELSLRAARRLITSPQDEDPPDEDDSGEGGDSSGDRGKTRTDSKGRQQPARKAEKKPLPDCPVCKGKGKYGPCEATTECGRPVGGVWYPDCPCLEMKRRGNPQLFGDLSAFAATLALTNSAPTETAADPEISAEAEKAQQPTVTETESTGISPGAAKKTPQQTAIELFDAVGELAKREMELGFVTEAQVEAAFGAGVGEKLRAAEIRIAGLESEIADLRDENAALKAELATAREQIKTEQKLRAHLGEMLSEARGLTNHLPQTRTELISKIDQAQQRLTDGEAKSIH